MGFLSKFEGKMEDTVEGAAEKMGASPLSPVQIAKKSEKQMRRGKMVGAGKQYAPTLYTILVSEHDDNRLFGYYPTLAGETETYLAAKAAEQGLVMDGQPLVRFIADSGLKSGKFEVIAEMVAAPLITQLRQEEMERYGLAGSPRGARAGYAGYAQPQRPAPRAGYARGGNAAAQAAYAYEEDPSSGYGDEHVPADAQDAQADAYDTYDDALSGYDVSNDPFAPASRGRYAQGSTSAQAQAQAAAGAQAVVGAASAQPGYPVQDKTMVFGQAPVQQQAAAANMRVYIYDVTNDRAFTLTGRPMSIGRESRNDIVIPDINVSRVHAEIRMDPATGTWLLSDSNSTNGTVVNGRPIKSTPLHDADRIIVGTTELEFQML